MEPVLPVVTAVGVRAASQVNDEQDDGDDDERGHEVFLG